MDQEHQEEAEEVHLYNQSSAVSGETNRRILLNFGSEK
jgi:hypothetical protein